jgi:transcriptional regulator with XRE-family HTH domain
VLSIVSHQYTPKSLNAILRDSNLPSPPYALGMGFPERLTQQRKAMGLNQEALGEAMGGMSKQGISHWETGRYEPNITQLARLCEVLDCTADWLLLGKSPEDLPPDAIQEAKFFNKLTPEGKKRWRNLRPVFGEAASDKQVEAKMAITKRFKEEQK